MAPGQAGLLAVVVSASTEAQAQGHAVLAEAIARQLANTLQNPGLAQPRWSKIISEKRATFSCTPALARPLGTTPWQTLCLAGDYIAGDYPATLEAAVQSGVSAAKSSVTGTCRRRTASPRSSFSVQKIAARIGTACTRSAIARSAWVLGISPSKVRLPSTSSSTRMIVLSLAPRSLATSRMGVSWYWSVSFSGSACGC
ncbi:MAG: FAD-dependent oxidoreductase [Armatimonadetes bacterium]|nr:FAD-dependent oxidoreductase [Armatimonadota bacterium]